MSLTTGQCHGNTNGTLSNKLVRIKPPEAS